MHKHHTHTPPPTRNTHPSTETTHAYERDTHIHSHRQHNPPTSPPPTAPQPPLPLPPSPHHPGPLLLLRPSGHPSPNWQHHLAHAYTYHPYAPTRHNATQQHPSKHPTPTREHNSGTPPPTRRQSSSLSSSLWSPHLHPHIHAQDRTCYRPHLHPLRQRRGDSGARPPSLSRHTYTQGPPQHTLTGAPLGASRGCH